MSGLRAVILAHRAWGGLSISTIATEPNTAALVDPTPTPSDQDLLSRRRGGVLSQLFVVRDALLYPSS
jgi:hypothetical protein